MKCIFFHLMPYSAFDLSLPAWSMSLLEADLDD